MTELVSLIISTILAAASAPSAAPQARAEGQLQKPGTVLGTPAEGYRGIWYFNQPTKDEYRYKYSGGMATYPQQHEPIAWYAKAVNKTFFVFGGTSQPDNSGKPHVVASIGYFDHASGMAGRPTVLMDRGTGDAHENPVLSIDAKGHLFVFLPGHGDRRPSYILRSIRPYDIAKFEVVRSDSGKAEESGNFSYPQPWFLDDAGFVFLHTHYNKGHRELFCSRSEDGLKWSEPQPLAAIESGHYQVSWRNGGMLGTAFNYHPLVGGLNARTNLYYMQTRDAGRNWETIGGKKLGLPLKSVQNDALVHDYAAEGRLAYLKDVNFDAAGRPVILAVTSKSFAPGPAGDPRKWELVRWTGSEWKINQLAPADHNYDTGCLHVEGDTWRLIAPFDAGPQPYGGGGEMWMWTSRDAGANWDKKALTQGSKLNHNYARRPVNADPGFYALWADGHPTEATPSRVYFCTREGKVFVLPTEIQGESARPEAVGKD